MEPLGCDLRPIRLPLLHYLKEIGLAHFSMPIISIGFGYVLQAHAPCDGRA